MTSNEFRPAWWLPGAHAQTLWAALIRRRPKVSLKRERLELPDSDFVDLDWTPDAGGPLVILFHGLEGSSNSRYAAGLMAALHRRGWQAVLMHFRGCSGSLNRLARTYHSGDTGDIGYLIEVITNRYPTRRLAAIGFSLGGNALLKYLGEKTRTTPLAAAATISVPFELDNAARQMERGTSRIYQWYLIRYLRAKTAAKLSQGTGPVTERKLEQLKTFREFDNQVTAPLHGFTDVDDYYSRSSSRQYLASIAIPTLILHSADDPLMTPQAIPEPKELSKHILLEVSRKGGHVGFVAGNVPGCPHYWLESRVIQFLETQLDANGNSTQDARKRPQERSASHVSRKKRI